MERNLSFAYAVTENFPVCIWNASLLRKSFAESIAFFIGSATLMARLLCFLKSIEPNHTFRAHENLFATISILYLQQHLS